MRLTAIALLGTTVLLAACSGTSRSAAPFDPSPVASPVAAMLTPTPQGVGQAHAARDDSRRLDSLQKGQAGTATRDDIVNFSPPDASMGALPMLAVEFDDDWVASIVAANNFGPAPGNLFHQVQLRDRQGRRFDTLGPGEFEDYERLLASVRADQTGFFGTRDLVSYAEPIEAGKDAFVLLIFHVAPDSEDLTMIPAQ